MLLYLNTDYTHWSCQPQSLSVAAWKQISCWVNCFWLRYFGYLARLTSHCKFVWQRCWQGNGYRQYATLQTSEARYIKQSESRISSLVFLLESLFIFYLFIYWFICSFEKEIKRNVLIFTWNENRIKMLQKSQKIAKIWA